MTQKIKKQTCKQQRNGWNGGGWISKHKRLAIYLRDKFACCYCGEDLHNAHRSNVTLDHIQPRSKNGNNDASNLITACKSCNSARGNKAVEDYAPGGALERIEANRHLPLNIALAKAIINGTTGDKCETAR